MVGDTASHGSTTRPGRVDATWSMVLTGPGRLATVGHDLPPLQAGWVRIRFRYCGVCGSDVSMYSGRRPLEYPRSIGHEFVAEVVAVAPDVRSLQVGTVVVSDLNFRCGRCDHCTQGRSHLCRSGQAGHFTHRGLSKYGDIEASYLVPVHHPLKRQLALAEPLSCVLHALDWAAPADSESVLVLGAGGLGMCLAFALAQRPRSRPYDIADRHSARRDLVVTAMAGTGRSVSGSDDEYDVVFDLSGTAEGLALASARTRDGGRLCSMSHLSGADPAPWLFGRLMRHDIAFKLSYLNGDVINLSLAAEMLADRWDDTWDACVEIVGPDRAAEVLAARDSFAGSRVIVDLGAGVTASDSA